MILSALLASIHLPLGIMAGLVLGVTNPGPLPRILLRLTLLVIVFTHDQRFAEERAVVVDLDLPQQLGESLKKVVDMIPYLEDKIVDGHIDNAVEATNQILASLEQVAVIKDALNTVQEISTGLRMVLANLWNLQLPGETGMDGDSGDDGHLKHEGRFHCPVILDNQTVNVDSPTVWGIDPVVKSLPPVNTSLAILHPKKRAGNSKWTYYGSRSFMSSLFAMLRERHVAVALIAGIAIAMAIFE